MIFLFLLIFIHKSIDYIFYWEFRYNQQFDNNLFISENFQSLLNIKVILVEGTSYKVDGKAIMFDDNNNLIPFNVETVFRRKACFFDVYNREKLFVRPSLNPDRINSFICRSDF